MSKRKYKMSDDELLEWMFDQTTLDEETGCRKFTGLMYCNDSSYGRLPYKGRMVLAHRLAYHLTNPDVFMDELCVLHKCDNPPCIRQSHLFLGTRTSAIVNDKSWQNA